MLSHCTLYENTVGGSPRSMLFGIKDKNILDHEVGYGVMQVLMLNKGVWIFQMYRGTTYSNTANEKVFSMWKGCLYLFAEDFETQISNWHLRRV